MVRAHLKATFDWSSLSSAMRFMYNMTVVSEIISDASMSAWMHSDTGSQWPIEYCVDGAGIVVLHVKNARDEFCNVGCCFPLRWASLQCLGAYRLGPWLESS